mgnify:CR=1 FL=1
MYYTVKYGIGNGFSDRCLIRATSCEDAIRKFLKAWDSKTILKAFEFQRLPTLEWFRIENWCATHDTIGLEE